MPVVKRDVYFMKLVSETFSNHGLWGKFQQIMTTIVTMMAFVLPQELPVMLGLSKPRLNIGRLRCIVPNQIYQQTYMSGNTNSTILKSRDGGKKLLIYIPAKLTPEYIEDIESLKATVKYIVVSNECHDSYADDCHKQFPRAQVLTPAASQSMVEEAVPVDATLESKLPELEKEFGITKMFNYDENTKCTSERSYYIELSDYTDKKDDGKKSYCLLVAQCGYGNYYNIKPGFWFAGFQTLLKPRGRYFRHYYHNFTIDKSKVKSYWNHLVSSRTNDNDLKAAIFTHGDPIVGNAKAHVRDQLLKFYVY